MKSFILFIVIAFLFLRVKEIRAVYDPLTVTNNKVGVHIFDINEIDKAAELVNSNGGAWGYVTVPLRADERNREEWKEFMQKCKEKKIIPIVRLATLMADGYWTKPTIWDGIDFANFLNDLDWPVKNRYVVIYNEPNHHNEWGNYVDPYAYADILVETAEIFKERNEDFFILPAGLDVSAPNDNEHMNWRNYIYAMYNHNNKSLQVIDGWNAHSYPNPNFAGSPYSTTSYSIKSYLYELAYVQRLSGRQMPVFITETGWSNEKLSDKTIGEYYEIAFNKIWSESNITAITPFVLEATDGPFESFSLIGKDGFKASYNKIKELKKVEGQPIFPENKLSDPSKVMGVQTENNKVDDAPKELFDLNKIMKVFDVFK